MYVIKCFNTKTEIEYISDIVENYETLVTYFKKLMEIDTSLKMVQQIPSKSHIGYLIPILQSEKTEYYIERYEFATTPSENC